jgi:hypothetical protein
MGWWGGYRRSKLGVTDDLTFLIRSRAVEGDMMGTKVEKRIVVDVPAGTAYSQ